MASADFDHVDGAESPVAVNVTPLVDVIFCLCVFFMISFRFARTEGTFDAWLPRDRGFLDAPVAGLRDELRILLTWDDARRGVVRRLGERRISSDAQLGELLLEARADRLAASAEDAAVTVDSAPGVPWQDVVTVVDLARGAGFERIEFALGSPPQR